jgi:outer membrane cobalamin receptor
VPSPRRRQDGFERQVAIPIAQTFRTFSYELTFAESRRDDDFDDPDDPYGYVAVSTESRTRRARLTARAETAFGTIVAGGEAERAEVDDVTNFGPNLDGSRRDETSFFVEDRYSHEFGRGARFEASAGVRHDDYDAFGSELSPRLAAAWIAGRSKFRIA